MHFSVEKDFKLSIMVDSGSRSENEEHLQNVIQTAMKERNEGILNLACGKSWDSMMVKSLLGSWRDDKGNTILHLAAKIAPPHMLNSVPAAGGPSTFQMRKDLIWFKKVKSILPEHHRLIRNRDQETAQDIFTKEHKGLIKKGETDMRSRATPFMLAASYSALTMLRVVIRTNNSSIVGLQFVQSLAVISSLISAVAFLSILTSLYAEGEFVTSLPLKLVIGQATFIFAGAMMLVAFTAELIFIDHLEVGLALVLTVMDVLMLMLMLMLIFSVIKWLIRMFTDTTYGQTGLISHDQDKLIRVFQRNYYKAQGSN